MAIQNKPFTLFQEKGIEQRNRSLRYDMNAMSDFEQLTGMGLAQLMATRALFAATRAFLWSGLKHGDRALTVERVGDLMQQFIEHGGEIDDLLTVCVETAIEQKALKGSLKKDEEDQLPNATPPVTIQP